MRRPALSILLVLAGCAGSSEGTPSFTGGGAAGAGGGAGGPVSCRDASAGIVPDRDLVIDAQGTTVADVLAAIEGPHAGSLTWAVGPDVFASVINGGRTSLELDVVPDAQQIQYISPDAGTSPCAGGLTIGSTVRFVTGDGSFDETLPVTWGDAGRAPDTFSLEIDLSKLHGKLKVAPAAPDITLSTLALTGRCAKSCTGSFEVLALAAGTSGDPAIAGVWSAVSVAASDGGASDASASDTPPSAD